MSDHRNQMAGCRRTERGAAMIIALIMLLVLTVLATTTSRMTLLEERMTGNTQDNRVAFQAAEAALRDGEAFLRQAVLPAFDGNSGLYQPAAATEEPLWDTVDWADDAGVRTYDGLGDAPGALAEARASYIIEELPHVVTPGETLATDVAVDEVKFFRVTAHGVGISGNAAVTLQTTYKR